MKTILVIDDAPQIREEIRDILQMENFNVLEAENGEDGLKKAIENMPDLIISDISMPLIDGYVMFQKLKKAPETKKIPLIFLSAKSTMQDVRDGMNLGAYDYLTKPISPNDLLLAIEQNLAKFENTQKELDDLKVNLSRILPHELLTPLNGISGFSNYLKDNLQEIPTNEVAGIIENINTETNRLHLLIENYLLYAELKIHKLKPTADSPLHSLSLIESDKIIETVAYRLANQENRINDIIPNVTPHTLLFNPLLFQKLINESISNALKFSKKGMNVYINTFVKNEELSIEIINQGRGMTQSEINEISDFKQFGSDIYDQRGSGLGLMIIKQICQLTKVKFNIESEYNKYFKIAFTFTCHPI